MLPARRSALRTAQKLRPRTQKRFESSHGDAHGHGHHAEPVKESFGTGFYVTLAAVPIGYGIYSATVGDEENPSALTKLIAKYDFEGEWVRRNALHTKLVEEAAFDRNLFFNSPGAKHVELKYPEQFNHGSPYNVHAGHQADLSKLIAHYEEKNRLMEEHVLKRREAQDSKK